MKKKFIIIAIMILLCPIVWAQKQIDRSQELKIGQLLPDISLQAALNYKKDHIDIKTFQDKVVILDFFDTFCTNCIAAMPKLQKLQNELGDKLQVILVTWQDKATIEKFFKTNAFLKENKVNLVTVYADTLLRKYFPHKGVPHTAWIYKNKVQAITFSDFVKAENIEHLCANGSIKLPVKSDFNDGLVDSANTMGNSIGSTRISGYIDGVEGAGLQISVDSISNMYKSSFCNLDIFGAYTSTMAKIKKPEFLLNNERIVWKVNDSSLYQFPKSPEGFNIWLLRNGISYERYDRIKRSDSSQAAIILDDLNRFLGLNVYWSTKESTCLVIKKIEDERSNAVVKNGEGSIEGTGVLAFMIDYQKKFPPVVDDVDNKVNIQIKDYSTLKILNEQLKNYGLELVQEIRAIEVLVFEEVN